MNIMIVGLGNPGTQYDGTRHNIGCELVDALLDKYGNGARYTEKFNGLHAKITIGDKSVILLKPQTYMNLSGNSVLPAMMFYKIKHNSIFVVHDDLDLEPCRIKVKVGGGSGGHNGLKSIDDAIGPNYHRIRIGIGKPQYGVSDYVLKKFTDLEMEKMKKIVDNMAIHIELLLNGTADKFLNKLVIENKEWTLDAE